MVYINDCTLAGLVDSEIVLNTLGNKELEVCDFVLKVNRNRKGKKEIFDLINCAIYGKKATDFVKRVSKGDCIYISCSYRATKIEVNAVFEDNDFSHFYINDFKIITSKKNH